MKNNIKDHSDNSNYTDGFPINDNTTKKDEIESKDPSRPFSSDRKKVEKDDKSYNPSGTTMNDEDKYKK